MISPCTKLNSPKFKILFKSKKKPESSLQFETNHFPLQFLHHLFYQFQQRILIFLSNKHSFKTINFPIKKPLDFCLLQCILNLSGNSLQYINQFLFLTLPLLPFLCAESLQFIQLLHELSLYLLLYLRPKLHFTIYLCP